MIHPDVQKAADLIAEAEGPGAEGLRRWFAKHFPDVAGGDPEEERAMRRARLSLPHLGGGTHQPIQRKHNIHTLGSMTRAQAIAYRALKGYRR